MARKTEAGMMVRNSFSNLRVKSKSPRQPRTAGPNEASLVQPAKLILLGDDGSVCSGGQRRLGGGETCCKIFRMPPPPGRTKSSLLKSACSWRWRPMHMSVVVCLLCDSQGAQKIRNVPYAFERQRVGSRKQDSAYRCNVLFM